VTALPIVSGKALVKALEKAGFRKVRQKGSHLSLKKGNLCTVVPLHRKLAKGTTLAILKQAGLTKEELSKLLS